jgi:hypothetical protein
MHCRSDEIPNAKRQITKKDPMITGVVGRGGIFKSNFYLAIEHWDL